MSKSSIIKKEILEILKDGQKHNVFEIKDYLREKHADFEISDGIFSNSFRSLTLSGKLRNVDRGVYCINSDMNEGDMDKVGDGDNIVCRLEKENKIINNEKNKLERSKECLQFESKIAEIINRMREEFTELANDINIMEADEETVSYILKVRYALGELEEKIKCN